MVTRNINTEVIYNLAATRNITKALSQFGIAHDTDYVLAIVPHSNAEKVEAVRQVFDAHEQLVFDDDVLDKFADHERICQEYDIQEKEREAGLLVDSIVTRISCRESR